MTEKTELTQLENNQLEDNELGDKKTLKNDSGLKNMARSMMNNPQMHHYTMYLIFGVITTLVNLVIFKLLIDRGIHYTISTTIAFVLAVSVAFWTNRTWVFRSQSQGMKAIFREMTSFFSVRILTYFVDIIGLVIFIELVHIDEFISKIIINVVVVVLNYLLSRYVVFQART